MNIDVVTLNCGTIRKLHTDHGLTSAFITLLVDHLHLPPADATTTTILALQELHTTEENFHRLSTALTQLELRLIGHTRNELQHRDYGTALFVSNTTKTASHRIFPRSVCCDILLQPNTRLSIATTYLPYGPQTLEDFRPVLDHMGTKLCAGNSVLIMGDFNTPFDKSGIQQRRPWTHLLNQLNLHRASPTPPVTTSKNGNGHAQGFICSADILQAITSTIHRCELDISDHHIPIRATAVIAPAVNTPNTRRPRIERYAPMSQYGENVNKATSFTDLLNLMEANTGAPRYGDPPRSGRKLKQFLKQMYDTQKKELLRAQIQNPRLALHLLLNGHDDRSRALTLPENANTLWATALATQRWVQEPVSSPELLTLCREIPKLSSEAIAKLYRPVTTTEILAAKAKWGHKKVFNDFTVQVLNLLDEERLQIVANELSQWTQHRPAHTKTILGAPKPKAPPAPDTPDELPPWLLKHVRPLCISPIFHALFNGIISHRLVQDDAIPAILCPAQVGFLPNRSTQSIILATILAIFIANSRNQPIVLVKADGDKAYDKSQFITQAATADAAGILPLAINLGQSYTNSVAEILVTNNTPGEVRSPLSGFSQGDASVCQRFPLTTEPAVRRAYNRCKTKDPTLHKSRIDQFADDSIIREPGITPALTQLTLLDTDMEHLGYKMGTIEIACNRPSLFWNPTLTQVQWKDRTLPIQSSIRILGACIHLTPDSECAPHRCTICKQKTKYPLCEDCDSNLIQKLYEWQATPIDKVALLNSQIVPALLYAPYTCEKQQQWSKKFYNAARQAITKVLFGGYHAIYALPPAEGGIGLHEWSHLLTLATVRILERETTPSNSQGEDALTSIRQLTRNGHTNWPSPIAHALGIYTLHLHCRHVDEPISSQRQNSKAYVLVSNTWNPQEHTLCTNLTIHSTINRPEQWQWYTRDATHGTALANTLATATTKLRETHHKIVFKVAEKSLQDLIQAYLNTHPRKRIHHKQHGILSTLIEDASIDPQLQLPQTSPYVTEPQWLFEIPFKPQSAPLYVLTPDGTPSSSNAHLTIKEHIQLQSHRNALQAQQLAPVFQDREPNWHLSSLATTTVRAGTHYTTPLTHNDATTLFALRAGALTHANNKCTCGSPLTLPHIHSHIDPQALRQCELEAHRLHFTTELATLQIQATYLNGTLSTCLGWLYGADAPITHHKNRKLLLNTIRQAVTNYTKLMVLTAQQCRSHTAPLSAPRPPPCLQTNPQDTTKYIPNTAHVLYTDAALPAENPHGIGIGVVLKHNGHTILEAWKYTPKAELPDHLSSTIAEFAASTFGTQLAAQLAQTPIPQLTHCVDNLAVPEHVAGTWHTTNLATLTMTCQLRHTQLTAKKEGKIAMLQMKWIPRAQNAQADHLANVAIRNRTTKIMMYPHTN